MINAPMIHLPNSLQLSGFVLFGTSQMMVGLENSRWLRIPLTAFPALQNLSEDECFDYRLADNRTQLRWPGRDISLSVCDLADKATLRWNVRNNPALTPPGGLCARCSNSALASSSGACRNMSSACGQNSSSGSSRVLQVCGTCRCSMTLSCRK